MSYLLIVNPKSNWNLSPIGNAILSFFYGSILIQGMMLVNYVFLELNFSKELPLTTKKDAYMYTDDENDYNDSGAATTTTTTTTRTTTLRRRTKKQGKL